VQFNAFASKAAINGDRGHSSNDLEFLMTALSERHFRIFPNLLTLSIFFLATMGEGASQVD